ncbi:MAG TPA: histidinol dehydrogenase, partial [Candidatus Limnocylindrales bacterium]|nr:histidinol dehydrogenase [Candidatus Limnocylindrales bacterium]
MISNLPQPGSDAYRALLERKPFPSEVREVVAAIIADVRRRGDAAVTEYTRRFDGATLGTSGVSPSEVSAAGDRVDPSLRDALREAMRRIEAVHRVQLPAEPAAEPVAGARVWREWRPFRRVGLYVPGGRARYPSSVLMMAVPARIAGCPEVVLCSPPQPDGRLPDVVLAAAAMAGATQVHRVGGAQAIAAMAYGTETIARVDKIFGPGNAYVTAAKVLVTGDVAIDMPAGPSELVIVTDGSTPPEWLAADLRAQTEHSPDALGILVSTSAAVATTIDAMLADVASPRLRVLTAAGMGEAIRFADDFAPEHLALHCQEAERWLPSISQVGSVFLGPSSAPAAGDYATGANHVLPTGGSARSYGPLGVEAFGRMIQVQAVFPAATAAMVSVSDPLAQAEGLPWHGRSIALRNGAP